MAHDWSSEQSLRHDGPLPLYARVQARLSTLIEAGVLSAGSMLPPEDELCEIYRVSRITIRRAVSELASEGLIVARQGRGTFVRDAQDAYAPCLVSFTRQALRNGSIPRAELLGLEEIHSAEAARTLELAPEEGVFRLQRLRFLDDLPQFVATTYLPTGPFRGLSPDDFSSTGPEQSIYSLFERFGVVVEDGHETVTAVSADDVTASFFDLTVGAPVVQRTCVFRDADARPVIYEDAVWGAPQRTRVRPDPRAIRPNSPANA